MRFLVATFILSALVACGSPASHTPAASTPAPGPVATTPPQTPPATQPLPSPGPSPAPTAPVVPPVAQPAPSPTPTAPVPTPVPPTGTCAPLEGTDWVPNKTLWGTNDFIGEISLIGPQSNWYFKIGQNYPWLPGNVYSLSDYALSSLGGNYFDLKQPDGTATDYSQTGVTLMVNTNTCNQITVTMWFWPLLMDYQVMAMGPITFIPNH